MDTRNPLTVDRFIEYLREKEDIVISKRNLRYYALEDIFPHPAKIGGNRGFYYIDQIPTLKTILLMKSYGKSIKEIRELIGKNPPITCEGFAKLEKELIEKIGEALANMVISLYSKRNIKVSRSLGVLYKSKDDMHTSVLPFIEKLTEHLERYICVIPSGWDKKDFDNLLMYKQMARSIDGYTRLATPARTPYNEQYITPVEIRKSRDRKARLDKVKERIKTKVARLINEHILCLQKELEALKEM